jgi:hypothetical protein
MYNFKRAALIGWGWLAFEVFPRNIKEEPSYFRYVDWVIFILVIGVFVRLATEKGPDKK